MTTESIPLGHLRVGVFDTLVDARRAAHTLLERGFVGEQVHVICSDEMHRQYFAEFAPPEQPHAAPAGTNEVTDTLAAAAGGIANVVAAFAAADGSLVFNTGIGNWANSFFGGVAAGSTDRGIDARLASTYATAIGQGKILVAVEEQGSALQPSLEEADAILHAAGGTSRETCAEFDAT